MEKKLKIALFSGPIEYSACLAKALSEFCDVDFFYSERYAKQRDESILELLNSSIKKIPINAFRIRDIRNLWTYYKVARKLLNYDVIHIQGGNIWFSMWRPLFKRTPIIFTVHDPFQHTGLRKSNKFFQDIAQKVLARQSDKFIVHGDKLKKQLVSGYKLSSKDIFTIPHGEFSFYKQYQNKKMHLIKKAGDNKRILFFGSVRKNKGLEYLIKAEPIISSKYNNYKICIAGKFGRDIDYYRSLIQNKEKFELIDKFIPVNQIADLFENSDLVVLPYITATQSGVLPLAFGFGKPVVATDTGSIGEILESGKTGFLVSPCDEAALAEAILDLLLDENKRLFFGKNAIDVAKNKLSWKNIAFQTVKIYESCLIGNYYGNF